MSALPFTSLKFICSCCCWITCLVILIRPGGYFSSAAFVYRNPGDFSGDSAYKDTRNNNTRNNYGSTSSESSTTSSGSSNSNSAPEGVINNSRANYSLNGTKNVITNPSNDFVVSGDPSATRGNNNYHYYLNDDGGDRYSGKEPSKRAVSDGNDFYDENTDMSYDDDEDDDYLQSNTTGRVFTHLYF